MDPRRCMYHITEYLFFYLSESSSASIAFFHLIQSDHCLHSVMVLESGSFRRSATMVEKHELTTIVVWSNIFMELV
jgi:hypothetical protein